MSATSFLYLRPYLILFAVLATLTYTVMAQDSSTSITDHLALLSIKSMIKDDPQGLMTTWNHSTTDFCQWLGVTCSTGQHQRVTHLDLSSGGLTGTLSPSIGNLSFLRDIGLHNNSFSGVIPPEIGRLFRLRVLRLYSNYFTGNIPPTIINCSNLQYLHLGYNNLVGKIPNIFQRLTNLKTLGMPRNNLTDTISLSLYNCSSLKVVILDNNQLNGSLRENLGSIMPHLVVLSLSQNHIEGNFLYIPATLQVLDLSFNNFGGKLPSLSNSSSPRILELSNNYFVGSLHNLVCSDGVNVTKALILKNNHLSGVIPECWEKWSSLEHLNLRNNNLSGEFPNTLGSVPSLQTLDMHGNKFNGNLTKSFWRLPPNLTYFDISNNQFQGTLTLLGIRETNKVIDLSYNEFSGSLHQFLCSGGTKGTKALDVGNNHLSGVIPECWGKWPSLILLSLANNNLSGGIPRTFGSLRFLQGLSIRDNKISGRIPYSLMNLSYLKILHLGRNNLVGSIPTWIGIKFTLLKILNLRSNNFYGNIPHQLCYLSQAQILDLAYNHLSGSIPKCLNNLSVLSGIETNSEVKISIPVEIWPISVSAPLVIKGRENTYRAFLGLVMLLDLSSNNFSGQIPDELTTLRELKSLNLSRNQLTGKIPDKIGDMKQLESFDLSINRLSGELPMSLSRLNYLSSFNVSYNNLIGRVPTSTQIQSFNESSFFGNKLCGAPLTKDCVPIEVPNKTQDQKEDHKSRETDWGLIISIVLGFIFGFWFIVRCLIIS